MAATHHSITMAASIESMPPQKSSRSEEAHWSSFRGEVLHLQKSLIESLLVKDDTDGCLLSTKPVKTSRDDNMNSRKDDTSQINSKANIASKQIIEAPVDENDTTLNNYHDTSTENKLPQSHLQLSPLEELDDDDNSESINNDSDNDKNYSTTQPHHHQYLELIGMEEVDRSNLSSHDNHNNYVSTNNTNTMSHASQNTTALSIATQELAEMKLKLALTESERDELEFELMQSR